PILGKRTRPNNRVGKLEPVFSAQRNRFFCDFLGQRHDAKMSKKTTTDIFIGLRSRASQKLHPRNDADTAFPVARKFCGGGGVTIKEIEENVAVDQRIQPYSLAAFPDLLFASERACPHSRLNLLTWRENILDATG